MHMYLHVYKTQQTHTYVCVKSLSLGILVPNNNRDSHEKWLPNFSHFKHTLK